VRLTGDNEGLAALKALAEKDREYLKFLIKEAQSNTDLCAMFSGAEGKRYRLRVDVKSGDLVVEVPS